MPAPISARKSLKLATGWEARALRQHRVGQHNYEIVKVSDQAYQPLALGSWNSLVSADFSGVVSYRCRVKLPAEWIGQRLRLSLGKLQHAASVSIDGQNVGVTMWSPLTVEFTSPALRSEIELMIDVGNTLANELTSERVQKAWAQRRGPGWPGPYHLRSIEFEEESRNGGQYGPVSLESAAE